MEINECILTNNDCYKSGRTIVPKGIIVHSTGANNPNLRRYMQPDDGILGVNSNGNHWNQSGVRKCVHAFIGKDKDGKVRVYQTLPWNRRCWGCASGNKGTYNNSYIQFEICEDGLNDEAYFNEVFKLAAELCEYLMTLYPNISVNNVVSHHEAHKRGYASNHGDCDQWLKRFGKDMNWFRSQIKVKNSVNSINSPNHSNSTNSSDSTYFPYKVKITVDSLNVRKGPGTNNAVVTTVKNNEVYTIVEEKSGWGKLKSGAGWISLKYTKKV